MKTKPTMKDCVGCRDDFYNGHNSLGVKQCWSLSSATFVKAKDVPVDLPPPYNHIRETKRPSCYKAPRMVRVKQEALTASGYWQPMRFSR